MKHPQWLLASRHNVYSQRGEDGIIQAIFRVLPPLTPGMIPFCCEFGAADGVACSNTRNLLAHQYWAGVQIEADGDRFRSLVKLYRGNNSVICYGRTVGWGERDSLDAILPELPSLQEFELLSIDVDGNDWYCWAAVKRHRPRVVVIEFNPTFPACAEWVQPADPSINHGCSLGALCALAKPKGYELVAATEFNAFFVLRELFPLFEIEDNSTRAIGINDPYSTWVAQGYDGTLIPGGNTDLLWSGRAIDMPKWQEQIQVISESDRTYRGSLTKREHVT